MPELIANAPLTTFIAIYAAIVSTAVFVWTLRKDLRDRGNLTISVSWELQIAVGDNELSRSPKRTLVRRQSRSTCINPGVDRRGHESDFIGLGYALPVPSRRSSDG